MCNWEEMSNMEGEGGEEDEAFTSAQRGLMMARGVFSTG